MSIVANIMNGVKPKKTAENFGAVARAKM